MKNLQEVAIDFGGIPMTVTGTFTPAEKCIMYDNDMSGYPGSNAGFEIDSVQINGREINNILQEEQWEEIQDLCITYLEN